MLGFRGANNSFCRLGSPKLAVLLLQSPAPLHGFGSSDLPHLQVASTTPSSSPAGHPKLLNSGICKEFDFGAAIA